MQEIKIGDSVEGSLKGGLIKNLYLVVAVDENAGTFTYQTNEVETDLAVGWSAPSIERNVSLITEIGQSLTLIPKV